MAKLTQKEIDKLIPELEDLYPDAKCALDYDTEYHLLCAVMLSAQTTDVSVNKVTPVLFGKYPEPGDVADAPLEDLERILHPLGFFRTKAAHLKEVSRVLTEEYDGKVPREYDKLVVLPGVGRKTANVVLAEAFGEPHIAVDTHVFRLANRIGITQEKDVLKTELSLMKKVPKDHWISMHHALIFHGRRVCGAKKPDCINCRIEPYCKKNGLSDETGFSEKKG